jgi:hypothetical protein
MKHLFFILCFASCQKPPTQSTSSSENPTSQESQESSANADVLNSGEKKSNSTQNKSASGSLKNSVTEAGFKTFILTAKKDSGGGLIMGKTENCFGDEASGLMLKIKVVEKAKDVNKAQKSVKFEKIANCGLTEGIVLTESWQGWK